MTIDPTLIRRMAFPEGRSRPVATPLHSSAQALAQRLDALEGGQGGFVVGSGMAAASA